METITVVCVKESVAKSSLLNKSFVNSNSLADPKRSRTMLCLKTPPANPATKDSNVGILALVNKNVIPVVVVGLLSVTTSLGATMKMVELLNPMCVISTELETTVGLLASTSKSVSPKLVAGVHCQTGIIVLGAISLTMMVAAPLTPTLAIQEVQPSNAGPLYHGRILSGIRFVYQTILLDILFYLSVGMQ
eukprot:Lithocolla_globosa_v1_NODE_5862_length_1172_cov_160.822898.p2 type:complete len:191 gc:universal NODE_5862_length_1172_cov_160.822898:468-1040(+)